MATSINNPQTRRSALAAVAGIATIVGASSLPSSKDLDDERIAANIESNGSRTRAALDEATAQLIGTVDSLFPSLAEALAACPAGARLEVREPWTLTAPLVVTKPATIVFCGGSIKVGDQALNAIEVKSSGVTIQDPIIVGAGGNRHATGSGILVKSGQGTASPVKDFTLIGGRITEIPHTAVSLEYVDGAQISNVRIESVGYAGFMLLSAQNVNFTACHVRSIRQPAPWVNSYGFAISRRSNLTTEQAPRSRNITLTACTVTDHPKWEAFDTHGGENITFTGCTATNALVGFAIIPCSNQDKSENIYAPRNVKIIGCTVKGNPESRTQQVGIKFVGCGVPGAAGERATGVVFGCTVEDMGGDTVGVASGIFLQACDGVQVAGNQIIRARGAAVCAYHSNDSVTIIDNTFADMWTDTLAFTAGIYLRSTNNRVIAARNRMVSSGFKAKIVNDRGFYIATATDNELGDEGGNDFSIAKTSWAGSTAIRKSGMFGRSSAQPALSYSRAKETPEQAQMRTALAALGFVEDRTIS